MKILITGGAGFIGSHLVDALLLEGHSVRVLDNLDPQVHGPLRQRPAYLASDAELQVGDVRDPDAVARAMDGIEAVFHEAAAVGVGQSMYQMAHYVGTNSLGTAVLLQAIAERRDRVAKIVVTSSMSVYGEGAYLDRGGKLVCPPPRSNAQLDTHRWELVGEDNEVLRPVATREDKLLRPNSVYAVTKRDQEELVLVAAAAYGIPAVALRCFNAYGTRQALSNPYTGLLAIVCAELQNGHRPVIFEDGLQARDFVHVSDVVQANCLALKSANVAGKVYNVGSGHPMTVLDVVDVLSKRIGFSEPPNVVQRYRSGDIRHCFADISRIRADLGFEPKMTLQDGADELWEWVATQRSTDQVPVAVARLEERVLMH